MWRAVYRDGSTLSQFDSDGSEHIYTEIDRSRVAMIQLVKDGEPVFFMSLQKGQCFFIRQRVAIGLDGRELRRVWVVGWRQKTGFILKKMVIKVYFIFADGRVVSRDNFKPDHRLYYPIKFRPEEVP